MLRALQVYPKARSLRNSRMPHGLQLNAEIEKAIGSSNKGLF